MKLDEHVVNTVFQIFDANDDGCLSYHEFIAVMLDRIHRGFKVSSEQSTNDQTHIVFRSHTAAKTRTAGPASRHVCAMNYVPNSHRLPTLFLLL